MTRFDKRRLFIASKHHKEQVIAPLLERALGVECFIDPNFDTDVFGSFSGEVKRELDPLETLKQKCIEGMKHSDCDLVVASEGSFGPHPSIFFAPANDELLMIMDAKNNLQIVARELSTKTNFSGAEVETPTQLQEFAKKAGFPGHALILRAASDELCDLHKGITHPEVLSATFNQLRKRHGKAYVETDMRAMFNPSRMQVIHQAAHKLVEKIRSECPACKMPGFDITEAKSGLLCSRCGMPTASIKSYVYACQHCSHMEERLHPQGKTAEDPMYCPFCNP